MYKAVLRNELLGTRIDGLHQNGASNGSGMFSSGGGGSAAGSQNTAATNGLNLPIAGVGPVAGNAAVAANTIPAQVNNFIGANASMQTGAHVRLIFFKHFFCYMIKLYLLIVNNKRPYIYPFK